MQKITSGERKNWIDKEISWISFNDRVLQEALDPNVPLIERIRFLGIYSNTQDEFFKVRVANLKRSVIINEDNGTGDTSASELLAEVQHRTKVQSDKFDAAYASLLEEFRKKGIYLLNEKEIDDRQKEWCRKYFKSVVLRRIRPIIITETTDLVSFLKDQYTYLTVKMTGKDKSFYSLIEVPTDDVPRIIPIPKSESPEGKTCLIILDDVIRINLDTIFKSFFDYKEISAYEMKMTRDAEYDLSTQLDRGVLDNMSESLKQRLVSMPVRLSYDRDMPADMLDFIRKKLCISDNDTMLPGARYHNFKDFLSFPNVGGPELENPPMEPLRSYQFDSHDNVFDAISERDILLYYPYYSFQYFTELLRQASYDPAVTSIKINIYRVAKNSQVIDSLIDAARNGKRITVVVELKARFDEANNIQWARRLTDSGVKVLFGMPSLKIHSKLCVISRMENGQHVRYAHIGTGNFNEKTAKIYTDFALYTKNQQLAEEANSVFDFIEYPYRKPQFDNLLVSPITARQRLYSLIDEEIFNAQCGREASITLKVNNLVDKGLVNRLYEAADSGVKIRMIIRGMCSLVTGHKNIRAISIVDRFLEHPRVMIFWNGGSPKYFISSADWMTRNLDYRIEVGTPIFDSRLQRRISRIVEIQLADNTKARVLDEEQTNEYVKKDPEAKPIRSQMEIYNYLSDLEERLKNGENV